ncbi:hypothetical protein PIB30_031222, partial [Stylosanthes scabra]|nr:hypothetical protein [Stylosanthes scabra]
MHITTYVKYISLACNQVYQRKTEPPKQNPIDRKELTFDDGRCYYSTTSPSLRSCGNANDLNVSSLQLRESKNEECLAFDNTLRVTIVISKPSTRVLWEPQFPSQAKRLRFGPK